MDKICNVLVAQTSMEEKQMDYIRNEAAKGDVEIRNMKKAISVREVHKCLKETENGEPKYTVLIIQQRLDQSKELVSAEELMKMRKTVPGLRILLCTSKDMAGSMYLQQVFEAGVYTAFYEEDGTMKNIVDLIRNGRSAKNAIAYYQISEDNPETRKQIGYIEKERLKKLLTLIHNAKDSDIDDVLKHIRTMLTKKEILFLISNMREDDVEKVFFRKGMGLFFNQEKYRYDKEEQESSGLLKRFKKTELSIKDYILEPDELDARIELVNIKRKAKEMKKREQEQVHLAEQVKQIEEDLEREDFKETGNVAVVKGTSDDVPVPQELEDEVLSQSNAPQMTNEAEDVVEEPVETSSEESTKEDVSDIPDTKKAASNTTEMQTVGAEQLAALQTLLGSNVDPTVLTALLELSNNSNQASFATLLSALHQNNSQPQPEQKNVNADVVQENNTEETYVEKENNVQKEHITDVEIDLDVIPDNVSEDKKNVSKTDSKNHENYEEEYGPVIEEEIPVAEKNVLNENSIEEEIVLEFREKNEEEKSREDEQKRKADLAALAKTPLVLSPLEIKDKNVKKGKFYYVISAGKHSGATTMSSVLAYTYKHRHKDKKVCVCSYDGNIDDYANLIDEELSSEALDREIGKLTYNDVDFFIIKRSEILKLQREYDVVFIDMKGIGQFNKSYRRENVFLVTQGSTPQIKGLHKTIDQVKEIGFSNVSIIATLKEFDEEQEKTIRQLLDCPLYNIGFLHSATRYCRDLRNSF